MATVCVSLFFSAISRDIHTVAVYVTVLMEPTSAGLCELLKPGALLKWVGVPEANAPAIRKEWFSMFGASETGAASVIFRLPPDLHKAVAANMRICKTCGGQTSAATCFLPLWF